MFTVKKSGICQGPTSVEGGLAVKREQLWWDGWMFINLSEGEWLLGGDGVVFNTHGKS